MLPSMNRVLNTRLIGEVAVVDLLEHRAVDSWPLHVIGRMKRKFIY